MFLAGALHLRRRYDVVQANSLPDSVVFAALVPRLLGARVLLDLHECMPEYFATKFETSLMHPGVRFIAFVEQMSIRFATFVITCTQQMRETFISRGAQAERLSVVLNSADEDIFDPTRHPRRFRRPDEFVLICHGAIEENYGLDTIVRAVALLKNRIPGLRLDIYGDGSYRPILQGLVRDLGVTGQVRLSDSWIPIAEVPAAIANADVGIVAVKRDAFRDLTLCNKMYDFLVMGVPAIVSRTRAVEAYYGDSSFELFTSENEHDLARAILRLYAEPETCARLAEHAVEVNEPYRWKHQREIYQDVIERLVRKEHPRPERPVRARLAQEAREP
jgi:glycosyltransferase involved in cell wall biosynthesis